MDLTSEKRVLLNAPLAGYDDDFSTMTMKTFDLVSEDIQISQVDLRFHTVQKNVQS